MRRAGLGRTCGGEEVEVGGLLYAPLPLELLALALEVLHHVVLPRQLVIIAVVVDPLPLLQPHPVEVLSAGKPREQMLRAGVTGEGSGGGARTCATHVRSDQQMSQSMLSV